MKAFLFVVLFALIPAIAAASPLRLNSGKTIEVIAVGPLRFSGGPPALMLRYETRLPLTDIAAVRKETDEIWQHFVADVDRAKFDSALIQANSPPSGVVIKTSKSYGFVFTKRDGIWRTTESETTATTKLTDSMLRDFYSRWDWLLENYDDQALGLYLEKSWRLSASGTPEGAIELLREPYLQSLARARTPAPPGEHHRDILSIRIDANTNTAIVECRETSKRHLNGRQATLIVERTTDHIAFRAQSLLVTNSSSIVEKLEGFSGTH